MKRFYPLSYAPVDDDYLFEEDEYRESQKRSRIWDDIDDEYEVEEDRGDPLRLAKKSSYERAVS